MGSLLVESYTVTSSQHSTPQTLVFYWSFPQGLASVEFPYICMYGLLDFYSSLSVSVKDLQSLKYSEWFDQAFKYCGLVMLAQT